MSRTGVEPKPAWRSLPREFRDAVGRALGAPVRRAERVYGGYGPAPTFRMLLQDGRRAFFKGVGPDSPAFPVQALEREKRCYRELQPYIAGWSPRVLGEVHCDGWQALLLEDLGPATVPPWTEAAGRGVMQCFAEFHRTTLGRSLPGWLPQAQRYLAGFAGRWCDLLGGDELRKLAGLAGEHEPEATQWLLQHGPALAMRSMALQETPAPHALLHGDLRSDNLRWHRGRLIMFDWPHIGVGPPEFDVAATAQSITVDGGPSAASLIEWYEERLPLRRVVLDGAVAAIAGYFADMCWRDEIPGLPRLRSFQRAQLRVTLAWAARRLELPEPRWLGSIPI